MDKWAVSENKYKQILPETELLATEALQEIASELVPCFVQPFPNIEKEKNEIHKKKKYQNEKFYRIKR